MKYILSIISIIVLSLGCLFFDQENSPLKQVNIPIQAHIEPEKKIETTQIKKEDIGIKQPSENKSQKAQQKVQAKPQTSKAEVKESPPIKKEVPLNSQYLSANQINQIKSGLLTLINQERSSPVSSYRPLEKSVAIRANEAYQKWSHTRPNGTKWNTTLDGIINIKKVSHGENLAQIKVDCHDINISWIVASLHKGLVNSPTHYKVMTNENYKKVNIGVYSKLNNNILTITIAQHFIT